MSLLTLLWPHGLMLLWLQDACLVAAGVVAFRWMVYVVSLRRQVLGANRTMAILVCGLLVMIFNPWTYAATSFDIHIETYASPFISLPHSNSADIEMVGLGFGSAESYSWEMSLHFG